MIDTFFRMQMERLINRFGAKAFDQEFNRLVWLEASAMTDEGFRRFVDVSIGSRPHNRPPLIVDFRDARLSEEKRRFESDLRGATDFLKRKAPEEMRKNLRLILSKEFGGVEKVSDALEIAKHRRAIDRSNGKEPA